MTSELSLTIILTIFGWYAIHALSARRDRKKEWREFARKTVQLVDVIEKKAIRYHTGMERDTGLEVDLKSFIDKLDIQVQLVKKNLKLQYDISFFRAAITLENFQTSKFVQQNTSSPLVQDITWHAVQLTGHLYNAE